MKNFQRSATFLKSKYKNLASGTFLTDDDANGCKPTCKDSKKHGSCRGELWETISIYTPDFVEVAKKMWICVIV